MAEVIKVRNVPAQHIGVVNSAPCPEMNIITKEITENGRYEARTEGVTGFDPVIVNVPSREEIGYENGYTDGYSKGSTDGYADALAKRTELEVTANGEYIPEGESTGFSKVSVNLPSDAAVIDGIIDSTLTSLRSDTVTAVGEYALAYRKNLVSVDLPSVVSVAGQGLARNNALREVNLPNVTSLGDYAFDNDKALETIILPKLTGMANYCFRSCTALTRADFSKNFTIGDMLFYNCTSLATLILRSPTKVIFFASDALNKTPIKNGTGFVYVPDDLVEDYKVATNWATIADQIKPISELEE